MTMNPIRFLFVGNAENSDVTAWKIKAFEKTIVYGFFPLCCLLITVLLALHMWVLFFTILLYSVSLLIAYYCIKKKRLNLSVHFAVLATTATDVFLTVWSNSIDSFYFGIFMLIIAGIFLGKQAAFVWTFLNIAILCVFACINNEITMLPSLITIPHNLFLQQHDAHQYVAVMIFLFITSAFLSILFEYYLNDLIYKVIKANNEKTVLESKLLQAQKLESIGLVAGGIAHDFGHQLSGIKSCASILKKKFGCDNNAIERYTNRIAEACDIQNATIGRLLSFARKTSAEKCIVRMHDCIEGMVNLLRYLLNEKITIRTIYHAQRNEIWGNISDIQSIIMNLGVNAGDAMPNGGVLTISTFLSDSSVEQTDIHPDEPKKRAFFVISVSDTGIGIEEYHKDKLFTPFFTTKEPGKGSGLGLVMVERAVKNHHGKISVSSTTGEGTTFIISFPLVRQPLNIASDRIESDSTV